MTDDRSVERAARSWLESGPTEAPDRAVEAALLRIQTTKQERDWHVPWRTQPMSLTVRLLAGAAAMAAIVIVGGVILLRPGSSPDVGGGRPSPTVQAPSASPTASAPATSELSIVCGLLSNSDVAALTGSGGLGATQFATGSGAATTCNYRNGPGDVILEVTRTTPGGGAAFQAAKGAAGAQVVADIGTDAVFDPATSTLYVAKGDVLVTIVAGTPAESPQVRLITETAIGKLVAGRM
ncbi:MAG TPA: hypothetical protein VFY18_08570 [Candidatus Limnocylindrales bacterium]|nr:hypothetical protein [Candidatus Limnocylindrales bacterium]